MTESFLVKLKMIMPEDCKPHKTIVFFDEIQKCPEIVTKIKFLVDEGSFKYVMSGSLLGVELKGIASAPVGYLTVLRMNPMDFEEFMIANSISQTTLDMLKAKYESEDKKLKLKSIYDIVPAELNKQNKKFVFTMLDKELKFDRYENSFLWLKDAGVVLPVYNTDAPIIPLLASKSSNVFRLFSNDIGLLTSSYPVETKIELLNKNGEVNNGAHFENVVAQQLIANGFEPYFCKKKNLGELDFVIEMNGRVVPIEVKSGKNYKAHKALEYFMNVSDYHLEKAYVFSTGNVEQAGNIVYLPIYMNYLLKEKTIDRMIVDVDIEGL